jgi:hypothetical protein
VKLSVVWSWDQATDSFPLVRLTPAILVDSRADN